MEGTCGYNGGEIGVRRTLHTGVIISHCYIQVLAAGGLGTASSAGVGPAFRPLLLKASAWVIAP